MAIGISIKRTVLVFLLLLGGVAEAGLNEGIAAYNGANYKLALNELTPLAMKGSAVAQTYLGLMYAYGRGVHRDDAKSLFWLQMAADQGDNKAQYAMGVKAANGMGVPKNKAEALKWLRLAADGGNSYAEERLMELTGEIYVKSPVGVQLSYDELRDVIDANKAKLVTVSERSASQTNSR